MRNLVASILMIFSASAQAGNFLEQIILESTQSITSKIKDMAKASLPSGSVSRKNSGSEKSFEPIMTIEEAKETIRNSLNITGRNIKCDTKRGDTLITIKKISPLKWSDYYSTHGRLIANPDGTKYYPNANVHKDGSVVFLDVDAIAYSPPHKTPIGDYIGPVSPNIKESDLNELKGLQGCQSLTDGL